MAHQIRAHYESIMAPTGSSCSLSILGILIEALQIPGKNNKAILSITLFIIFPFCLLSVCADLSTTPVMINIVSEMEQLQIKAGSPHFDVKSTVGELLRQTCLLLGLEIGFLFSFCVVSLISIISVVRTSATNYNLEELGLNELFSRIGRTSKGELVTWIYMSFITVSLVGLILILVGVLSVTITALKVVAPIVLGIVVVILSTLSYLYLAAIGVLSLVISVVEEDFRNYRAFASIGRVKDAAIIKRRLKASLLSLVFSVVSVGTALLLSSVFKTIKGRLLETEILVFSCMCLVKLFLCLGYAVFYYEYRLKYGELVEEEERLGNYGPLPITARSSSNSTTRAINSAGPNTTTAQGDACEP